MLSPSAATLVRDIKSQKGPQDVWDVLDSLPRGIGTWEDLMEAVSELRRQREWQTVILVSTYSCYKAPPCFIPSLHERLKHFVKSRLEQD